MQNFNATSKGSCLGRIGSFTSTLTLIVALNLSSKAASAADGFAFELSSSAYNSDISIKPGIAFGTKAGFNNFWGSVDYLTQTEVEFTNVSGAGFDSDTVLLRAGYDWYFVENMALTAFVGSALSMDDINLDDDAAFEIESGDNQVTGGLGLTLELSPQVLFTLAGSYFPGYQDEEAQTLLSFTISWRPISSRSSFAFADSNEYEDDYDNYEEEESIVAVQTIEEEPEPEPEPMEVEPMEPEPKAPRAVVSGPENPVPKPAPIKPVTTRPAGPFSSGLASMGKNGNLKDIDGVKVFDSASVNYKYGIQLGFYPDEKYTANMLKQIRSKFDMSTVFVAKYADGYRIFYEGFNQFSAAKEVLPTVREAYKDAFIKKF